MKELLARFRGERVLLLQGPMGPFFAHVAAELHSAGAAAVHKINFNGGDWFFYRRDAIAYRGTLGDWPAFLARYLVGQRIDAVVLYGDCRPVHRAALTVAAWHGLTTWVFEEGYVRPNYVTFEPHGVNGFSKLPADAAFYAAQPEAPPTAEEEIGSSFGWAARWAMLYYTVAAALKPVYPHRTHHRPASLMEGLIWVRSFWRKHWYRANEKALLPRLAGPDSKRFFLVPLQVAFDSQVRTHSRFESVPAFIATVLASFAAHAPADALLVVKHHPLDRGYSDYTALLRRLARRHGVSGRVLYVHDLHLPTLLENARGVVVINSTVGLTAMHHGTPVLALGKAVYDLPGLAFQGRLREFWVNAESQAPELGLYWKFRNFVVQHTQLNRSFYKPMPVALAAGPSPAQCEAPEALRDGGLDDAAVPATLSAG